MANSGEAETVKECLVKKCKICDEKFSKNSDFEMHMVDQHEAKKNFECESCGKTFLLQWRLKKHLS